MKYEKPSVVVLATAADVIQSGQGVKGGMFQDINPPYALNSTGAYEADE